MHQHFSPPSDGIQSPLFWCILLFNQSLFLTTHILEHDLFSRVMTIQHVIYPNKEVKKVFERVFCHNFY